MLGRSTQSIKKNTEALVVASKDVGLGMKAEKSQYMITSRDENAGQELNIKTDK